MHWGEKRRRARAQNRALVRATIYPLNSFFLYCIKRSNLVGTFRSPYNGAMFKKWSHDCKIESYFLFFTTALWVKLVLEIFQKNAFSWLNAIPLKKQELPLIKLSWWMHLIWYIFGNFLVCPHITQVVKSLQSRVT